MTRCQAASGRAATALSTISRRAFTGNYGQARCADRLWTDARCANYGAATDLYAGLGDYFKQQYGGGANAYGDATGANGAEGFGRVRYRTSSDPGYGFQMDQGLQALAAHARRGWQSVERQR
jgi:hypothetical protein